jgi:hypothetical protein
MPLLKFSSKRPQARMAKATAKPTPNVVKNASSVWLDGGAGGGAESGGVGLRLFWLREYGGGAKFVTLVFEGGADEGGK